MEIYESSLNSICISAKQTLKLTGYAIEIQFNMTSTQKHMKRPQLL